MVATLAVVGVLVLLGLLAHLLLDPLGQPVQLVLPVLLVKTSE